MNNNKKEALRWLEQSLQDLEASKWNKKGGFYPQSCFLSQQAGEKILKGFLYGHGERLILGHSLLELLEKCIIYERKLKEIENSCRILDRFYIPTRYPNVLPSGTSQQHYTEEDADQSLQALEKIIYIIKPLIENLPD